MEFLELKEHQALLDQWAHLVCQENLELVNLVPLAILENLASLVHQEEMVVLDQWVPQDQGVTQEFQA